MGRNNRQRRAYDRRRKERRHESSRGRSLADVRLLIVAGGQAAGGRDDECLEANVVELARTAASVGTPTVGATVAEVLTTTLSSVWEGGWQPAEVARAVRRGRSPRHADLVTTAMAAVDVVRDAMPKAWEAQLNAIGAQRWWGDEPAWLEPWARRADVDWTEALTVAVETLGELMCLPAIEQLLPPPSAWDGRSSACRGPADDAVLTKVRALLAKAESTTFEPEAEALTAKAQELMARHAIDDALARASGDTGDSGNKPVARRVPIEDPYASAKSYLLRAVADTNGVRTVWYREFAMMALVGFAADLDGVEALFTSLLVQATKAMLEQGRVTDQGGRSRTRSFRQSFLMAFATRIHERLAMAALSARRQAEGELEMALLPVLAGRDRQVDDTVSEMFPNLRRSHGPSVTNGAGWAAGRAAGERATLGPEQGKLVRAVNA